MKANISSAKVCSIILMMLPIIVEALPVADTMQTQWVGEQMVHNGFPMQIQSFSSKGSAESILAFYRSEWAKPLGKDIPGFVENSIGEWQVISRLEGNENIVIQVKSDPAGGSEGFISTMETVSSVKKDIVLEDFPQLSGSEMISNTSSVDNGKNANTIILRNRSSVISNRDFYRSRLISLGYKNVHEGENDGGDILFFNGKKANIELVITASGDGETIVFANVVRN